MSSTLEHVSIGCNRVSQATDMSTSGLVAYAANHFVALYRPLDPHLRGVRRTLKGHTDRVNCVRFIRRGCGSAQRETGLVSGSADHTLRVWRRNQGGQDEPSLAWKCSAVLKGHTAGISCIAVMRGRDIYGDTDWIASSASDGTIRIWKESADAALGDSSFECTQTLPVGSRFPMCLALSYLPGSQVPILISGGTDSRLTVFTASPSTHQFTKALVLEGHTDWIRSVEIATFTSEDGVENKHFRDGDLMVASASQDKYIRTWRVGRASLGEGGEKVNNGFEEEMMSALTEAGLQEGDLKLSTKAHIMEVDVGGTKERFTVMFDALLMAHDDWVHSAVWQLPVITENVSKGYHQPMSLLSASADKSLLIWRPDSVSDTWVNVVRLGEIGGSTLGFYGALLGPDGRLVVANGYNGAINIWEESQSSSKEWHPRVGVSGHTASAEDLHWDPSGSFILTTSLDQSTRLLAPWTRVAEDATGPSTHVSTWHEIARPQIHGYDLHCVAFVHKYGFVSGADEKVLRVFEAPRTFVLSLEGITGEREQKEVVEARPVGASVPALGLSNKAVFEGDISKEVSQDFRNLSAYAAVSSTPTSFLAHMTTPPFEQHLLQHTLWPEVNKLYGHGYELVSVAASPDGSLVASSCKAANPKHAAVKLWDTKTWKELGELNGHALTVTRIAFSPCGTTVLTVGRDRAWCIFKKDGDDGEWKLLQMAGKAHARIIWDAGWSHDGQLFVTGSRDKTIKVWAMGEGKRVCVHEVKLEEGVTAVSFAGELIKERYVLAVGLENGDIQIHGFEYTEGVLKKDTDIVSLSDAHAASIRSLAWRPRPYACGIVGNVDAIQAQLASCSADWSVRLFTLAL
ncbi:Elongator subunit elp2 [Thoreauomyces humboldtii]|nr:Elongator subunit elp2 [Thoreauomyces humboldtii]